MIDRYKDKVISAIFNEQEKYRLFTIIELDVIKQLYGFNIIDVNDYLNILNINKYPTITAVKHFEKETKHETAAFIKALTQLHEQPGKRWIHYGLTSSDILDTYLGIVSAKSADYINKLITDLIQTLKSKIRNYADIKMCGRTHGMVADYTTLHNRLNNFIEELVYIRHKELLYTDFPGKISGPVGTNEFIRKEIEENILDNYNLVKLDTKSQIVPRQIYACYISKLAALCSIISKYTTDIRLLQMDGIQELSEGFEAKQYGSSSMAHKKNPITCEKIAGLARLIRSYVSASLENIETWLERDMSHSSVERITIEDSFHITAHIIKSAIYVIRGLVIRYANIDSNNIIYKNKLESHNNLCFHIRDNGFTTREESYKLIYGKY